MTNRDDELVVLVDRRDTAIGVAPKLAAHRDGLLHRAVSVLLFDEAGCVLLQRRAAGKYHSPLLWSNTCCGHPRPNESPHDAARRRLREEMGIANCPLESAGWFVYRADVRRGLVEYEVDYVYVGRWSATPNPDPQEVASWRWCTLDELAHDLAVSPGRHTVWLPKVLTHLGVAQPGLVAGGVVPAEERSEDPLVPFDPIPPFVCGAGPLGSATKGPASTAKGDSDAPGATGQPDRSGTTQDGTATSRELW